MSVKKMTVKKNPPVFNVLVVTISLQNIFMQIAQNHWSKSLKDKYLLNNFQFLIFVDIDVFVTVTSCLHIRRIHMAVNTPPPPSFPIALHIKRPI